MDAHPGRGPPVLSASCTAGYLERKQKGHRRLRLSAVGVRGRRAHRGLRPHSRFHPPLHGLLRESSSRSRAGTSSHVRSEPVRTGSRLGLWMASLDRYVGARGDRLTGEVLEKVDGVFRCTEDDLARAHAPSRLRCTGRAAVFSTKSGLTGCYARNPFRHDDAPTVWICRRDGRVVGTEAGIPFDLVDRRPSTSGVHGRSSSWWTRSGEDAASGPPSPRRIGSRVRSRAFSMSHLRGIGCCVRRRSTDIGHIPMYFRLVDAKRVLRWEGVPQARPLAGTSPDRSGSVALGCGRRYSQRRDRTCPRRCIRSARPTLLWQNVSRHYPVISRRDATWLRWRFDECPDRHQYLRYYVLHRQRLIGYLVLRRTEWNGCAALAIVDYLAAPGDVARLLASSVRIARQLDAAAVLCNTLNLRARGALWRSGFFRRRNQGIRFFAYTGDESLLRGHPEPYQMVCHLSRQRSRLITPAMCRASLSVGATRHHGSGRRASCGRRWSRAARTPDERRGGWPPRVTVVT